MLVAGRATVHAGNSDAGPSLIELGDLVAIAEAEGGAGGDGQGGTDGGDGGNGGSATGGRVIVTAAAGNGVLTANLAAVAASAFGGRGGDGGGGDGGTGGDAGDGGSATGGFINVGTESGNNVATGHQRRQRDLHDRRRLRRRDRRRWREFRFRCSQWPCRRRR